MKAIKTKAAAATIRVPADCKTLNEAPNFDVHDQPDTDEQLLEDSVYK